MVFPLRSPHALRLVGGLVVGALCASSLLATPVSADTTYTVRDRETLSHVALRTGVPVTELVAANGLTDPDRVRSGQTLVIPSATGRSSSAATVPYTVQPGDTLSEIALRAGVSSRQLAEQNGLADRHSIRAGQVLMVPAGSGPAVVSSGSYPRLPSRIVDNPERLALVPLFEKWAAANEIPVDLLMAVAWQESGWNNAAVSSVGARGIGQIMPATETWIANTLIGRPELTVANPEDNIRMSARYLSWLIAKMGDERLAIASYYQGQGSVASGPLYASTEQYLANVAVHRQFFTPT